MKRYINEFIKLKSAADLLTLGLFPNAKEITESMGAYNAVRSYIRERANLQFSTGNVCVVCVGDGVSPRTAALFAFRTNWKCYSIDPLLRTEKSSFHNIKRLHMIKAKIEDNSLDTSHYDNTIILLVHSHAPMEAVLDNIKTKRLDIVAIPCCIPQEINNKPYLGYKDTNIWSDKNTVKIWFDVRSK